ncbi:MAG TPA: aminopeptidase P family N-terminal domain-containing protein, partial [Polyangiaceae bacterium]|nr:aminopeptidase P family N-terminal domain-containing protein [Polyangiaceae bacterium]
MPNNDFGPARFQRFDTRTSPATVVSRLRALRTAMAEAGLDGFLVPRADAHRGESVPDSEARLAYVTSFTGSAGIAVVGPKKAGLFIDSRYTLQAPLETDTKLVSVLETAQGGVDARIGDFLPKGGKLGFDPWLHTPGEIKELTEKLKGKVTLVPSRNLVDQIWTDRPAPPVSPVEFLGANRAGRSAIEKLTELRKTLAAEGADALVLTLPESINWLLNMRGRDVPNVPVVLGFALVPKTGKPTLFVHKLKMSPDLRKGLAGVATISDTSKLMAALEKLGASGKKVWLDPATAPLALVSAIGNAAMIEKRDPVLAPKSRKNDAEIGGMKEAQKLDAVALAKFLYGFDGEAPKGSLTEIGIVEALEHFRREEPSCVDASFDTISGAGPNGAIVHYHVDEKSNRTLKPGELMLLDSGAQYLSGTTDITRTLFTGKATAEQKDRFTRVLKGMIALSMARFPKGTTGAQLDVLARQFLWADGITYNHGTGHGVGAFLS